MSVEGLTHQDEDHKVRTFRCKYSARLLRIAGPKNGVGMFVADILKFHPNLRDNDHIYLRRGKKFELTIRVIK